jgi:hypothetical protein
MPLHVVRPSVLHPNPRTPEQAVRWAAGNINHPSQPWKSWCLRFVARAYGWRHSGSTDAWRFWHELPEEFCHYDAHAPLGALVVWSGGTKNQGHVALSTGDGKCLTTGWGGLEGIRLVKQESITSLWHMEDHRWGNPVFLHGIK